MINWNEVRVGETEIVRRNGKVLWNVCGNYDKWVWLFNGNDHIIESKDYITDWTIYDPWVEITTECEWHKLEYDEKNTWLLIYGGTVVQHSDETIKVDGRRVWKRRVG